MRILQSLWLLSVFAIPSLCQDVYTESVSELMLTSAHRLVRFAFEINTTSTDSHFLDIFPQSVASVLISNRDSVDSISGHLVRGRWRWPELNHPQFFPSGSSMYVTMKKTDEFTTSRVWTQTAYMLSSVLGASFESLDPEQKTFKWITPIDLGRTRVSSNPTEYVCTENLERLVKILPCRHKKGLAETILSWSLEMARSEYIAISLEGVNEHSGKAVVRGQIDVVLPTGDPMVITSHCPAIRLRSSINEQIHLNEDKVTVLRSIIASELGPERRYGKLVLVLTNIDKEKKSHSVEFHEQLPFFLVPLWHKYSISGNRTGLPEISFSDAQSVPTYITWSVELKPGETVLITLDVYKRFIPMYKFSFSFEKGFDMASAAYRIDREDKWRLTRGLVVIVPMPDPTSTFNAMAVILTSIVLFFGIVFRAFSDKRSVLMDESNSADRDPPLIKLIRWIVTRIKTLIIR